MASAQRKSSKPEACRKAPAKVITLNVSKGIKEIFGLFTNKLGFYEFSKDEVVDPDSSLERNASLWIMMKEFLFSICFILLSSNLKLSIDIFIHLHVLQSAL